MNSLRKYLCTADWQESIEAFIIYNCEKFKNIDEYSSEQYTTWRNFQDIAEQVIESFLTSQGCSWDALERELEQIVNSSPLGPRDAAMKEVLDQLLAFDSFPHFATMMHQAYVVNNIPDEEEDTGDKNEYSSEPAMMSELRQQLISFGFQPDLVEMVLEDAPSDVTLESLVEALSAMEQGGGSNSMSNTKGGSRRSPEDDGSSHWLSFAEYYKLDTKDVLGYVAYCDYVLAEIKDGSVERGVAVFLRWATRMQDLGDDIKAKVEGGVDFEEGEEETLLSRYTTLCREYNNILEEEERHEDAADKESARLNQLQSLADEGTSDEQILNGLFARHEALDRELTSARERWELLTSSSGGLSRRSLEEMYAYIKQNVSLDDDLHVVSEEIFKNVHNIAQGHLSYDTILLLLDMHFLEDEQIVLKQNILYLLREANGEDDAGGDEAPMADTSLDLITDITASHTINDVCLGDLKHESKHSDSKQAKISDTAEVAPDFTKASAESKHEDVDEQISTAAYKSHLKKAHQTLKMALVGLRQERQQQLETQLTLGSIEDSRQQLKNVTEQVLLEEKAILEGFKIACKEEFQSYGRSDRGTREERLDRVLRKLKKRYAVCRRRDNDISFEDSQGSEFAKNNMSPLRQYLCAVQAAQQLDTSSDMFSDNDDFLEESGDHNTALMDVIRTLHSNVDNYMSVAGHLCAPKVPSGEVNMTEVVMNAFVNDVLNEKGQYAGVYKPRNDDSEVMRVKAAILNEYNNAKDRHADQLQHQKASQQQRLQQRLQNRASEAAAGGSNGVRALDIPSPGGIDDLDTYVNQLLTSTAPLTMPVQSPRGRQSPRAAQSEAKLSPPRQLPAIISPVVESKYSTVSNGSAIERESDSSVKNIIISQHQKYFSDMEATLAHQMSKQKKSLEARLRSMRESREMKTDVDDASTAFESEIVQVEEEISQLDQGLEEMQRALDKLKASNASESDVRAKIQSMIAPFHLTLPSDLSLRDESKNIVSKYTTENENLKIKMRLEQARQQQLYQKKLFERRKNKEEAKPAVVERRAPPGVNLSKDMTIRGMDTRHLKY